MDINKSVSNKFFLRFSTIIHLDDFKKLTDNEYIHKIEIFNPKTRKLNHGFQVYLYYDFSQQLRTIQGSCKSILDNNEIDAFTNYERSFLYSFVNDNDNFITSKNFSILLKIAYKYPELNFSISANLTSKFLKIKST